MPLLGGQREKFVAQRKQESSDGAGWELRWTLDSIPSGQVVWIHPDVLEYLLWREQSTHRGIS